MPERDDIVEVKGKAGYVEVYELDGKPVARLNHFDTDRPMSRSDLVLYLQAILEAHRRLVAVETKDMVTVEAALHRAAAEIESWPKWKRDGINTFIDQNLRS